MGIRDWFSKRFGSSGLVCAPSTEYPTALDAVRALLRIQEQAADDGLWVTLHCKGNGRSAIVEIAEDQVNFCRERIELAELLHEAGAPDLAAHVRPGGRRQRDRSLWVATDVSPDDVAIIVDIALARGLKLGEGYEVSGERHS